MQLKHKILGKLAYLISIILKHTIKIKLVKNANYKNGNQYLFAFWHGKQVLPIIALVNQSEKRAVLASPSKDGDILESMLLGHGYTVLRGSARTDSIKALKSMLKVLKAGYSLGFGCDGPKGPIFEPKQGLAYMSQKLQIPIVPIGSAFKSKKIFNKAWDKFELPLPFTKSVFYIGKPFTVDKSMDLGKATELVKARIMQAEEIALSNL